MEEYFDVLNEHGEYTNKVESRENCHRYGLWHKGVVVFIVSEDNKNVLLQQRSNKKKLWPNKWDITAGGHVDAGEFGYQAVIRETKEEIGIDIDKESLEFIGATTSTNKIGDVINNHINEYYIVHKDVDLNDVVLQTEEVQDLKWFTKEELLEIVKDDYRDLTDKKGCWDYLVKYFEMINK